MKIQIANVGLTGVTGRRFGNLKRLGFPSNLISFEKDRFISSTNVFSLRFATGEKYRHCLRKLKKIFTAPSWNIYEGHSSYYFVLYFDPEKQEKNQILRISKKKREATIYFMGKYHEIFYPLDQLLFQWGFFRSNAFMIHGCAFEINGRGFIVPGESGSGKTTLVRNLKKKSKKIKILNDERNIIWRSNGGKYFLAPTPWHGEYRVICNKTLPLDFILFINKKKRNAITTISSSEAFRMTVKTCFLPFWDECGMVKYTKKLENLVLENQDKIYRFSFKKDSNIFTYLRDITDNA